MPSPSNRQDAAAFSGACLAVSSAVLLQLFARGLVDDAQKKRRAGEQRPGISN